MATAARKARRGSTLVEMLFTLVLASTVVGAATLLYGHAVGGTLDSVSIMETGQGTDAVARDLDFYIRNALVAETKSLGGRTVLKLTMPANRTPQNANGGFDAYLSSYMHPRLRPAYEVGERVWIYMGTTNADIATPGTVPLIARRSDDATPTLSDVDWLSAFRDGAGKQIRRAPAVSSMTFSVTKELVTWTVYSSAARGSSGAVQTSDARTYRESRVDGSTLIGQAVSS